MRADIQAVPAERVSVAWTRAGRVLTPFAGAALVAGWLFGGTSGLLGAALGALLLGAPVLARLHANGLAVACVRAEAHTVGDFFVTTVAVENRSLFLTARELVLGVGERASVEQRANGFLAALGPGARVETALAVRLVDRGPVSEVTLVLSSAFPFGLFRCRTQHRVSCDLLGLPRVGRVRGLEALDAPRTELADGRRRARFGEEEFYGVRDWREGESLRRVHWKLSAQRDRLIARDVLPLALPEVRVLLIASTAPTGPWSRRDPSFERAVGLAATLVDHALRSGRTVRLRTTLDPPGTWLPLRGRAGLHRALVHLARVEAEEHEPWEELASALASPSTGRRRTAQTFAVLAGGASDSRRGRTSRRARDSVVLDVDDPGIDLVFQRGDARAAPLAPRAPKLVETP